MLITFHDPWDTFYIYIFSATNCAKLRTDSGVTVITPGGSASHLKALFPSTPRMRHHVGSLHMDESFWLKKQTRQWQRKRLCLTLAIWFSSTAWRTPRYICPAYSTLASCPVPLFLLQRLQRSTGETANGLNDTPHTFLPPLVLQAARKMSRCGKPAPSWNGPSLYNPTDLVNLDLSQNSKSCFISIPKSPSCPVLHLSIACRASRVGQEAIRIPWDEVFVAARGSISVPCLHWSSLRQQNLPRQKASKTSKILWKSKIILEINALCECLFMFILQQSPQERQAGGRFRRTIGGKFARYQIPATKKVQQSCCVNLFAKDKQDTTGFSSHGGVK